MRTQPEQEKLSESVIYENAIRRIRDKLGLRHNFKDPSPELHLSPEHHSPTPSIKLEDNSPSKLNSPSKPSSPNSRSRGNSNCNSEGLSNFISNLQNKHRNGYSLWGHMSSKVQHSFKSKMKAVVVLDDSHKDLLWEGTKDVKKERAEVGDVAERECAGEVGNVDERESLICSLAEDQLNSNAANQPVTNQQIRAVEVFNSQGIHRENDQRIKVSQVSHYIPTDSNCGLKEEDFSHTHPHSRNSCTQPILIPDSPQKRRLLPHPRPLPSSRKTQFRHNRHKHARQISEVKLSASHCGKVEASSDPILIAKAIKRKVEEYMRQRTVFSKAKGEVLEEKKLYKILEREVGVLGQRRAGRRIEYRWTVGAATLWKHFSPSCPVLLDLFLQEFNNLALTRCRYSGDQGRHKTLYKERRFLEKLECQLVLVQAEKLIKFYANPVTAGHWEQPEEILIDLTEGVDERSLGERLQEIKNSIKKAEKALVQLQEERRNESISRLPFMRSFRGREGFP